MRTVSIKRAFSSSFPGHPLSLSLSADSLTPGAIVKLLKQPGKLKKQKKFAAPFIGPLIIDRCVHDDIYRLRSMDGKKLKGRAVNVERIFPYHTDHEEHVEAPRANRLVADKEPP